MSKKNPITFIVIHKEAIETVHAQYGRKIKKTWEKLKKILPELHQVMKFNTFKQYLTVLLSITESLSFETEKDCSGKPAKTTMEKRLDKVRQDNDNSLSVRQKLDNRSKRILGWNVRQSNDGYYRCYRKIKNKVHSVYLGKELNFQKAQQRIREKENRLGLDNS